MKLKRLPRFESISEPIYMRAGVHVRDLEEAIAGALAGHGWFDCWASIDEAARVAVIAILDAVLIEEDEEEEFGSIRVWCECTTCGGSWVKKKVGA